MKTSVPFKRELFSTYVVICQITFWVEFLVFNCHADKLPKPGGTGRHVALLLSSAGGRLKQAAGSRKA